VIIIYALNIHIVLIF